MDKTDGRDLNVMNADSGEELLWFGDNVDDGYEILKPPEDAETYGEDCSTEDSDKEGSLEKDSDEDELEIPYTSTGSSKMRFREEEEEKDRSR